METQSRKSLMEKVIGSFWESAAIVSTRHPTAYSRAGKFRRIALSHE